MLENYVENTLDVSCRWYYAVTEELFTECQLTFFYDLKKRIYISIYLRSGVIMISGNEYKDWVENVFPILKRNMDSVDDPLLYNTLELQIPTKETEKRSPFNASSINDDRNLGGWQTR